MEEEGANSFVQREQSSWGAAFPSGLVEEGQSATPLKESVLRNREVQGGREEASVGFAVWRVLVKLNTLFPSRLQQLMATQGSKSSLNMSFLTTVPCPWRWPTMKIMPQWSSGKSWPGWTEKHNEANLLDFNRNIFLSVHRATRSCPVYSAPARPEWRGEGRRAIL